MSLDNRSSRMSFVAFLIAIFCFSFVFTSLMISTGYFNTYKEQTNTFSEIKKSLTSGNKLRMVIHYDKMDCYINGSKSRSTNKISGYDVESFEFYQTSLIGGKEIVCITIFNTQLVSDVEYGVLNSNVRTRLFENGSLDVQASLLTRDTWRLVREESFNASLSVGVLYFFNQSPARFTFEDNLGNRKSLF